ncbi:MAG: ATP-binding protein [Desulfobacterales bacterium]|nr:ATP-binding protein [Desulfobacterales bacterium]
MASKKHRILQRKIICMALFFAIVPLSSLGLTIYYQFRVAYTTRIMQDLKNMAENRQHTIAIFLKERTAQLSLLVDGYTFNRLKDQEGLEEAFSSLQRHSRSFVDLGVIDADGRHLAYVGPYNLKKQNYRDTDWFNLALVNDKYISDVFMGFRKVPHFIIAVRGWSGDKPWILRATINSEVFDNIVGSAQVGENGDAFIINKEGILQTKPRSGGNVLEQSEYSGLIKAGFGNRVAMKGIGGEKALFATRWIKDKTWLLVIKQSPQHELRPLTIARFISIVVFVGGFFVILLSGFFITRLMMARLIQSEREKAALDDRLIQSSKMAALGKLAAGIAHEVNNPLAVIKEKAGWIQDLLEEEDVANSVNFKEFSDSLDKIDRHVERARKVTHRLLGFARRMEPMNERVNVNRVLDETISFLENEAKFNNIAILTDYFEELPETMSDSAQLQQVFLNILDNAIDAIGKNGEVKIQTTYNSEEKYIAVLFFDNGPGIPEEVQKKIFDPFYTTREVGKGTGLGLSISYSIMEKLGGRISVDSQDGHGTVFTIILPMKKG